jgi:hypothetical protein
MQGTFAYACKMQGTFAYAGKMQGQRQNLTQLHCFYAQACIENAQLLVGRRGKELIECLVNEVSHVAGDVLKTI